MPATAILDAAEIEIAGDFAFDRVAVEQLRFAVAHLALEAGNLFFHPGQVTGLRRQQHVAAPEVTGDAVLLDPLPDDGAGLLREIEQGLSAGFAELGDQLLRRFAQAGVDLPAVPPRCAPADPVGLDQRHLEAALGEIERGGKSREPAADHTDIGANGLRQPRISTMRIRGRGVIGTCWVFLVGNHAALP